MDRRTEERNIHSSLRGKGQNAFTYRAQSVRKVHLRWITILVKSALKENQELAQAPVLYVSLSSIVFIQFNEHTHQAAKPLQLGKRQNNVNAGAEFFTLNKNKTMKLKYSKSHQNYSEFSRSN